MGLLRNATVTPHGKSDLTITHWGNQVFAPILAVGSVVTPMATKIHFFYQELGLVRYTCIHLSLIPLVTEAKCRRHDWKTGAGESTSLERTSVGSVIYRVAAGF